MANTEKEKGALDKGFSKTTSENAQKAPEEPSYSEDGDNASRQSDANMLDSQSRNLCT